MKPVNEYFREYSEIPGLQHAATVCYKLFAGQESRFVDVGEHPSRGEGIYHNYT